jgi:hypothetical protein
LFFYVRLHIFEKVSFPLDEKVKNTKELKIVAKVTLARQTNYLGRVG